MPAGMMEGANVVVHPNAPNRDVAIAKIGKMAEECSSVENEDRLD
jgi:hypothetical protein